MNLLVRSVQLYYYTIFIYILKSMKNDEIDEEIFCTSHSKTFVQARTICTRKKTKRYTRNTFYKKYFI